MKTLPSQRVKVTGDIPSPRFGHTLTMVSQTKAVLFGGAVSLGGRFVITNETFLYDFVTSKWTKINFKQEFVPSERAAHAAAMVSEMQMIIYGGAASGTQGLLKDELYILDLRKEPVWKIIEVTNKSCTPGQRYGHTMIYNRPYLVVFAGNSGNKAENDVWLLNIYKGPFTWQKYEFHNNIGPSPRVYHAAALCEEGSALGMIVVFGGRKQTKKDHNGSQRELQVAALNDIWGLRKHRNGSWDWVAPPRSDNYTPLCRYQHLVCFMGNMLIIMGGRSSNPEEAISAIQIYDTQKSEWHRRQSVSRYRHALALYNRTKLFVHGGFEPQLASQPLDSMISIDLSSFTGKLTNNWIQNANQQAQQMQQSQPSQPQQSQQTPQQPLQQISNTTFQNTQMMKKGRQKFQEIQEIDKHTIVSRNSRIKSGTSATMNKSKVVQRDLTPSRIINSIKNIRLSNQVIVATGDNVNVQIQRVPVNSLLQESKKLTAGQSECNNTMTINPISTLQLAENVLMILMPTDGFKSSITNTLFPFKKDKVLRLAQQASKMVVKESSLVGIRAPAKIFGSLYGRYHDLIRLFQNFGFPDDQQMESNEYVFLGNYVDKGFHSLETVCLLMALKIKYPDHITLLRGKHEDSAINRACGFAEECTIRLGENINELTSVYYAINSFFDCLPLAAAVQDRFLCVHSGLGNINSLIQIKDVTRPVKVKNSQTVVDLLWSGRQEKGVNYQSKKLNEEELDGFLENNCLEMLINTQDGIQNGISEDRNTLSIFSVTNYGGSNNKGGVLKINKNLQIVPYLVNGSPTKRGSWVTENTTKTGLIFNPQQVQLRKGMFQLC